MQHQTALTANYVYIYICTNFVSSARAHSQYPFAEYRKIKHIFTRLKHRRWVHEMKPKHQLEKRRQKQICSRLSKSETMTPNGSKRFVGHITRTFLHPLTTRQSQRCAKAQILYFLQQRIVYASLFKKAGQSTVNVPTTPYVHTLTSSPDLKLDF